MREQVLPFYLVCDESGSMGPLIDLMNRDLLPELHRAIATDPVVADKTRFAIIGFAQYAHVLQPLVDLSDLAELPELEVRGTTNFGKAFTVLKQAIEDDVRELKREGHRPYRPAVFFLSDGRPTDKDWISAHGRLVDPAFPLRPNIIAFGLGDEADAAVTSEVATVRAFMSRGGVNPAEALTEFARSLTRSIVQSGSHATQDGISLVLPEQVTGFRTLELDAL